MITASETGQVPPNINYESPNSKSQFIKDGKIIIPTELTPLQGEYFSVNTVGSCGTFGNILLRALNIRKKNHGIPNDDLPRLVIISGRTETAIQTFLDFVSLNSFLCIL